MDSKPQIVRPVFSQMLRERLIEDACLRAYAGQLQAELEQARAAAGEARRASGLVGRWLGTVRRQAPRPSPEELAQAEAREKESLQRLRELETIIQRYTTDLDTLITMHLQETRPEFYEYSAARTQLGDWENAVKALRTDIRALLKALGQARNSASSGYDKARRTLSATAQEQFTRAVELVHAAEERLKVVNTQAQERKGVPGVTMIPCASAVKSLPGLEMGAMQKEFDRLTRELEAFEKEKLADLMEPVVQAALARQAQAQAYVTQYREELRVFSDQQMKPDDMARAIPTILARQAVRR